VEIGPFGPISKVARVMVIGMTLCRDRGIGWRG
jgi:hypothetical protein